MIRVSLMLSGSLVEMDRRAQFERTWYSRIKKFCALSGFAVVFGGGLSIINPTILECSTFELIKSLIFGEVVIGCGIWIMERCYYPPTQSSSENSLPPPLPDTSMNACVNTTI